MGILTDFDNRGDQFDLQRVLDTIPGFIATSAPTGETEFVNRQLLQYLGKTAEEARGWQTMEAVHPDDLARLGRSIASWLEVSDDEGPVTVDLRLRGADGAYRWFELRALAERDAAGGVLRWYYLVTDVEDRKRAEDSLRDHERDLRQAIDSLPAMVNICAPSGDIEFCNRQLLEYFGKTLDELRGWETGDVIHPDDRPTVVSHWHHSLATGEPFDVEHRLRRADGTYQWVHARNYALRDSEGVIVHWYSVILNIDDRRRAEEKLRRSEGFLLEAQRLSHTGAWVHDLATGRVASSPEMTRVFDVQQGEDISDPSFWFGRIHPDDRDRVMGAFGRSERDKTQYEADYRIVLPDGSIRYQHSVGHPVLNEAGDLVEFVGTAMDTTDEWRARLELENAFEELRATQARLSHAAKVATVGELAASIAHEVSQPLAAVVANAHASLRWLAAEPPNMIKAVEAIERVARDGRDAGDVVRRVRALFQRAAVEKLALSVNEVIAEVLRLVEPEAARRSVTVRTEFQSDLPPVMADRVQLQQLILNLLVNGLEAMDPVTERPRVLSIRSRRRDDEAVVEVRDNGVGLQDPDKVFDAFFTTKDNGMGMGLAISRSIVEAHGGKIWAAREGTGSAFLFTLPIQSRATS